MPRLLSFLLMKLPLLPLLTLVLLVRTIASAEDDWRTVAREFLDDQNFATIEVSPKSRDESARSRARWIWMQRVLLPPFEKHLAQWPQHTGQARQFVSQALMAKIGHPDVDPTRPWEALAKEGTALVKAKVEEPLVLWLTAWAVWESHEGTTQASDYLNKALRHKLMKDYPSVLATYIHTQINESRRNARSESIARTNAERFKHMMKSAPDIAVYATDDDELLFEDLWFVFTDTNVTDHGDELRALCATPHFTPWLQEMLLGSLENRIAWANRGGGFADSVQNERWSKFTEHQNLARPHFQKAWELRPDRPQAAAAMIDLIKSGNGPSGDTLRLWFDRAITAQVDYYDAYYHFMWALRPRWGGSLDQLKAFYCASALMDRPSQGIAQAMRKILDYIEDDVDDIRVVLSKDPMKQTTIAFSRALAESDKVYFQWQRSWRLADLGLIAWAAGDYDTAYETLEDVPAPFPRQTRRRLDLMANETDVRGQSALFAFGLNAEWEAAEEALALRHVDEALQSYQDMAARFQSSPPALLLQRIAACKFEKAFATGKWVPIRASEDMADWYHRSGFWSALKTGTLVNRGHDGPAYLLHNGRTGANFELRGVYEYKSAAVQAPGITIMVGYHSGSTHEDWIGCSQWADSSTGAVASLLRRAYLTEVPRITPPMNGRVWRFHIICRDGALTYRLNHRDIVVDHRFTNDNGSEFEFRDDSVFGFSHHMFKLDSETHVRYLGIRKLAPPEKRDDEPAPTSLKDLRDGFAAQFRRSVAVLNAETVVEANLLAGELKRANKIAEADKVTTLETLLKSSDEIKLEAMPVLEPQETALATLLRGYHASIEFRRAAAQSEWKSKANKLSPSGEHREIDAFIHAELSPKPRTGVEEPLSAANTLKWQMQTGEWKRDADVLTGKGDSIMLYDFKRAPPFQIDFELTVRDGKRARLIMDKVKFANEGSKTTFGLYPQPKGALLFNYEPKKPYHITIKATQDKTELLVDGVKVCDGPKIENPVDWLQFRAGDDYSKGTAEFREIRISPLP